MIEVDEQELPIMEWIEEERNTVRPVEEGQLLHFPQF